MSDASDSESGLRHLVGARFHRRGTESASSDPPPERPASRRPFRVVLRGYDPREVDARLAAVQDELDRLRAEVHETRAERDAAQRAADRLRDEVTRLSARLDADGSDEPDDDVDTPSRLGPLGNRAARLAHREAQLLVATARKEAAEIVRTARLQAARDREVADRLIGARIAELAQQSDIPTPSSPPRPAP